MILTAPFLTAIDPRAAVKGSRDPLGIQQIWTRFGRHVVGNLTTVSTSARDFASVMLGYHFAEQVAAETSPGTELATFLRWEQLAAYSRAEINRDYGFRGTERVKRRLSENKYVTISADTSHQILSNQRIYGLWGLYTVAARSSGLLEGEPARLTPAARQFVDANYMPVLAKVAGKGARDIREFVSKDGRRLEPRGREQALVEGIARVLPSRLSGREPDFFRQHLVHGGPGDTTDGRQRQLALLIENTLADGNFVWSPGRVRALAKESKGKGKEWFPLADHLHRIAICESVLAPASLLFYFVLGFDGRKLSEVISRVHENWPTAGLRHVDAAAFSELETDVAGGDPAAGSRWIGIANDLASGNYAGVLKLLLQQNRAVMITRNGLAWTELDGERVRVRFRDERGHMVGRDELPHLWRFPYFLDALRTVSASCVAPGTAVA